MRKGTESEEKRKNDENEGKKEGGERRLDFQKSRRRHKSLSPAQRRQPEIPWDMKTHWGLLSKTLT